jgi:hypothetical protein
VSEVTIRRPPQLFASLEPANDLEFRYGTNADRARGRLTVAGT